MFHNSQVSHIAIKCCDFTSLPLPSMCLPAILLRLHAPPLPHIGLIFLHLFDWWREIGKNRWHTDVRAEHFWSLFIMCCIPALRSINALYTCPFRDKEEKNPIYCHRKRSKSIPIGTISIVVAIFLSIVGIAIGISVDTCNLNLDVCLHLQWRLGSLHIVSIPVLSFPHKFHRDWAFLPQLQSCLRFRSTFVIVIKVPIVENI